MNFPLARARSSEAIEMGTVDASALGLWLFRRLITVLIFPSSTSTHTEKASADCAVPGHGGRRKPARRRLADRVSERLTGMPNGQSPLLGDGCYMEQMHPRECEI